MFSHDTAPFHLACYSLYGRGFINNAEEEKEVIETIKARREFVKTLKGNQRRVVDELCGFVDERELMG